MSASKSAVAATIIAAFAPWAAVAQGVCVECNGPDRSYRCTIKDSERVQHVRGSSRAIEFVCISEIARVGGHQSCRVNTSFAGPCIGHPHEIDLARPDAAAVVLGKPPVQHEAEPNPSGATDRQPSQPLKKGPPGTLEELARDTMTKSKEQISAADEKVRKAGDAVGGAMKKTWDCMASLFSKC